MLKWIDIPEIKTFYIIETVYLKDGTYFIVAHNVSEDKFLLYVVKKKKKLTDQSTINTNVLGRFGVI